MQKQESYVLEGAQSSSTSYTKRTFSSSLKFRPRRPNDFSENDESTKYRNSPQLSFISAKKDLSKESFLNDLKEKSPSKSDNMAERILKRLNNYVDCTPHHRFVYSDSFRKFSTARKTIKNISPTNSESPKNNITQMQQQQRQATLILNEKLAKKELDYDTHLANKAKILVIEYEAEFNIKPEESEGLVRKKKIIKSKMNEKGLLFSKIHIF